MPSALIGSGSDTLVLSVSEDAYQGDAQFTIGVDGQQVGDALTASALHSLGQDDTIAVKGNFGAGPHSLAVNFLNDAYDGSAATDRNLYVDAVTYDSIAQPGSLSLLSAGTQTLGFGVPQGTSTIVGLGSDSIRLQISEDAYQGDAQFTVGVDGQQVGGILTAAALHGSGYEDSVLIEGTFGFGPHTVTVNFLNDAYDGTPATDRNLYVDGVGTSGAGTLPDGQAALYSAGPRSFSFTRAYAPNTKVWVGGNSGNSFDDPLNWTPSGTPQSTDQLFIPAGTINVNGGDANGATLRPQPYREPGLYPSSVSSTATINLNSAGVRMLDDGGQMPPVYQPPYPSGPSINASGSSSLSANFSGDRIYGTVYATINVEADSTLSLGQGMGLNYSRVSINGAAGAQLENDGTVTLQSNSTLTINADTVGVGSFAPEYATLLEFGGAVGSGQTVAFDATVPASLLVDHPGTFKALIDWQATARNSIPTVDLRGVVADSFDYSNDLLKLYSGSQVVDTTRLAIRPATDGNFPDAGTPKETLHVAQGADGVLLSLTTASATPALPVHV